MICANVYLDGKLSSSYMSSIVVFSILKKFYVIGNVKRTLV